MWNLKSKANKQTKENELIDTGDKLVGTERGGVGVVAEIGEGD